MAQTAADQAQLREALKRTQAAFDNARTSQRFKPTPGTYQLALKSVGDLEARPTKKDPNKMMVMQELSFVFTQPPYANQEWSIRLSVTEGLKWGGQEWKQAAFLIDQQSHDTIEECADVLRSAVNKVVFTAEVKERNGYPEINFLSAEAL